MNINEGARIIINDWLHIQRENIVHLITDETKLKEAEAFKKACEINGAVLKITVLKADEVQSAKVINDMKEIMSYADYVIGASSFSFVTSEAVSYILKKGARFLSLPLSTNDGSSLLEAEFLKMSPLKTKLLSLSARNKIDNADNVHITTKKGTNIYFDIHNRKAGVFNGESGFINKCASASFEIYIAPNEYKTSGRVILDGSLGYLGLVSEDVEIIFKDGYIDYIENNSSGKKLKEFLKSFSDPEIYLAGELGIGLNKYSRCLGRSYIEDESTYSTFHIGMGRNISLGGIHEAKGHFDIVIHDPTIIADKKTVMKEGRLLVF